MGPLSISPEQAKRELTHPDNSQKANWQGRTVEMGPIPKQTPSIWRRTLPWLAGAIAVSAFVATAIHLLTEHRVPDFPPPDDPKPDPQVPEAPLGNTCVWQPLSPFHRQCAVQADQLTEMGQPMLPTSPASYFVPYKIAALRGSDQAQILLFATDRLMRKEWESVASSYESSNEKGVGYIIPFSIWVGQQITHGKAASEMEQRKISGAGQAFNCRFPGVDENCKFSMDLFKPAANKGDGWSQYMLGLYYLNIMFGKESNPTIGVQWLEKSAAQRISEAELKLAQLYDPNLTTFNSPVEKSLEKAVYYYERAAESGSGLAQVEIGLHSLKGLGVLKNTARGLEWITRAAEQPQNSLVMLALSEIYSRGFEGIPKNPELAKKWKERASTSNEELNTWINSYYHPENLYGEKRPQVQEWAHCPHWPLLC